MSTHVFDLDSIRTHFGNLKTIRESVGEDLIPASVNKWKQIDAAALVKASALMPVLDESESASTPIWADDATLTVESGKYAVYTADAKLVGLGASLVVTAEDVADLRGTVRSLVAKANLRGDFADFKTSTDKSGKETILGGAEVLRIFAGLLGAAPGADAPEVTRSRSAAPVLGATYGGASRDEDLALVKDDDGAEAITVRGEDGRNLDLLRPTGEVWAIALSLSSVKKALSVYFADDRRPADFSLLKAGARPVLSSSPKGEPVVEVCVQPETLARWIARHGCQHTYSGVYRPAAAGKDAKIAPAMLRIPATSKVEIESEGYATAVANRIALASVKASHAATMILGGKPTITMSDARSWETGVFARLCMQERGEDALIEGARDNAKDNFNALK